MIRDLYPGLQKKANIDDATLSNVRIYEAHNSKVYKELDPDYQVAPISDFINLYAEVIPKEERHAEEGDTGIYCFHFDKEVNKPYGVPFKFLVKPVSSIFAEGVTPTDDFHQGELFKDTKVRLSARIGIKGKQFDRIKFAIVPRSLYSKPAYLNDGKY